MTLLVRSRVIRWPRYLVFSTGPKQTNSMDFEISKTNQVHRRIELVMARPSSTCMGIIRRRGAPEEGMSIEGCGGVVQRPTKTAWSASHLDRPKVARMVENNLCHSYADCLSPYRATKSRRTVATSASG